MSEVQQLRLAQEQALGDLQTYLARAARVDPDGAVRLMVLGPVLAVYVSPLHLPAAPTVLGLRTFALADPPPSLDVTVLLASMAERFARLATVPGPPGVLPLPPGQAPGISWAGVSPPRNGWEATGLLDPQVLTHAAQEGIAEVAAGAPEGSGGAAVAALRARVWSRPLDGGVPAGAALAAWSLGFLSDQEPVAGYERRPWTRLSTVRGHVLCRPPQGL